MSRVNRLRGITISLHCFRQRYILPKRGEKARLKREAHRLSRAMAKAELRHLDLDEWEAGEFKIPPLFPTKTSCVGSNIYVED